MHQKTIALITASIFACASVSSTIAETLPEDAIKYRQTVMQSFGAHISAIVLIFTGKVDQPDQLAAHSDALAAVAAYTDTLFPADSADGETHALPLIWEEPDQFAEVARNAKTATAALAEAINGGDRKATSQAFKAVGEACKGCHDRYREEHEH
jgi:cytochrome c556